ncbi:MAG: deoxyguanosinetriphosphate triphosphohydrolase, partial [Deltaproteobacteria bacterium]
MERKDLASYASKSSQSKGRRYVEEFKDDRPAFERDRDRIIHCAAFRRLMY